MPARLIAAAEAIVTALVLSAENYLTKVGFRRTLWSGARLKKRPAQLTTIRQRIRSD
jgi:hypothetical protein